MHQTLFHIPNQIGSLPLFGFGLLLALWVLFSIVFLAWLARRQGCNADTLSYAPLLVLVAGAIWGLLPALSEDGHGLPIRGYGVMLLVAVSSAVGLAVYRAKRLGQDPDMVFALAFWTFVPGILGARLFYIIEYWETFLRPSVDAPELLATLGAMINVSEGGLVVYGSFVGALLGLVMFVRKHGLPFLATCDLIAPSMVLGLALGRVGCLLNGCCYGGPCDAAWGMSFPPGSPPYRSQVERGEMYGFRISGSGSAEPVVLNVDPDSPAATAGLKADDRIANINGYEIRTAGDIQDVLYYKAFSEEKPLVLLTADGRRVDVPAIDRPPHSLKVQPTQVFASLNALVLCLFLLAYDPYCRRDGQLFAVLLTIYPITRFLLEIIRTDESPIWVTGLSISQNVSLGILLLAAVLWAYILRHPPRKAFLESAHPA